MAWRTLADAKELVSARTFPSLGGGKSILHPDFGAVGDGETDDKIAFRLAAEHSRDTGETIIVPNTGSEYVIRGGIALDFTARDQSARFRGVGQPKIRHEIEASPNARGLKVDGFLVDRRSLAGPTVRGGTVISIADTTGVEVGDVIGIRHPLISETGWGYTCVEISEVAEVVDATTIRLVYPMQFTLDQHCTQTWIVEEDATPREFNYPLLNVDPEVECTVRINGSPVAVTWGSSGRTMYFEANVSAGDVVTASVDAASEVSIWGRACRVDWSGINWVSDLSRDVSDKNFMLFQGLSDCRLTDMAIINRRRDEDWPFDFALRLVECVRPHFEHVRADHLGYCYAIQQTRNAFYRDIIGTRCRHVALTSGYCVGMRVDGAFGWDNRGVVDNHPSFDTTVRRIRGISNDGVPNVRAAGVVVRDWHIIQGTDPVGGGPNMSFGDVNWRDTGSIDCPYALMPLLPCVVKNASYKIASGVNCIARITVKNPSVTIMEDVECEEVYLHNSYGPARRAILRRIYGARVEVRHAPDGLYIEDCTLTQLELRSGNTNIDGVSQGQNFDPLIVKDTVISAASGSPILMVGQRDLGLPKIKTRLFQNVTFIGDILADDFFSASGLTPVQSPDSSAWTFRGCIFDGVAGYGVFDGGLSRVFEGDCSYINGSVEPA